jgi:predicted membrane-bound mannosyltransferase
MVVYTSGFRYAGGLESGLLDGLRYWLSQHEVGRGSQRWFFYLTILGAYEWLVVGLALAGGWFAWRHRDPVGAWLATMAVVQLAVYSWAGEKFAWLMLHPLIPLVLLAGRAAQQVWDTRPDRARRAGWVIAFAFVAAGTLAVAVRPAITDGHDPRELLVTVQTSERVHELAADLRGQQDAGEIGPILVDEREGGSWPWAWYLHGMDVLFVEVDPSAPLPAGYDVYIVAVAAGVEPTVPAGHTYERFPLRAWWLPDYDSANVGDLLNWLFTRETWNPTGSSDQFLIRRD